MDGGDDEDVALVVEEALESSAAFGFTDIVAFPGEFGAGVRDGFVEVETFGQKARGGEEDSEIAQVGVNGVGYTWILDFDCYSIAI